MDEEIYQEMCDVTGPHRQYNPVANHIIYGSFHFEQFNKTHAWRNTLVRFNEFFIPQKLTGQVVYDFGSCLGSLTFESIRRGAAKAIGFEYNIERVNISNRLAQYLHLEDKIQFVQIDIDHQSIDEFVSKYGQADTVFCCALDAYVNKEHLYKLISAVTKDICYFETNSQIPDDQFKKFMSHFGFNLIIGLGSSRSDINPTRHLYLLQKTPNLISQKRSTKCRVNGQMIYIDNDIYKLNDYVVLFYVPEIYENIKKIYDKIKDIKYVPTMLFHNPYIIMPFYENNLLTYQATSDDKKIIKKQLIDFIRQINQRGIIHRDLHIGNAFFHKGVLKIIDWEVASENVCNLRECYDINGTGNVGYEYHLLRSIAYALQSSPQSFYTYLDHDLTLDDFIN